MGYLTDSLRALGTTLRNMRRPATTIPFPQQIREREERFRTSFALLHDENGEELCVACLACERICPSEVIKMKVAPKRESPFSGKRRGYLEDFTLDLTACIYCELCVQVCPTDAIVMTRVPEVPGFDREDLVLTMDKLYANEHAKPLTWATASKLNEMQEPPKVAKVEPAKTEPAKSEPAKTEPAAAEPAKPAAVAEAVAQEAP